MSHRNIIKWGRLGIYWDKLFLWGIYAKSPVFVWIDLGHIVIEWRKK